MLHRMSMWWMCAALGLFGGVLGCSSANGDVSTEMETATGFAGHQAGDTPPASDPPAPPEKSDLEPAAEPSVTLPEPEANSGSGTETGDIENGDDNPEGPGEPEGEKVGIGEGADEECGYGDIYGVICSPTDQVFVNGAEVWVESEDCEGQPSLIETVSDANGFYSLYDVPNGYQTVHVHKGEFVNEFTILVKDGKVTDITGMGYKQCFQVTNVCGSGEIIGQLCPNSPPPIPVTGKAYVNTFDCNEESVYVEVKSDDAGFYTLSDVPAGPAWVMLEVLGETYQYYVDVVADGTTTVESWNAPSVCEQNNCGYGGIEGYVCAPSGIAVGSAEVTVLATDCDGNQVTLYTLGDGDGNYFIDNVPTGPVTIKVQKGSFSTKYELEVHDGQVTYAPDYVDDLCFPQDLVKIAVVTGEWDYIEEILDALGLVYDLYDGVGNTANAASMLSDINKMMEYDVIFFNCGSKHHDLMLSYPQISQNLMQFVGAGNSLYASDWAYVYAEFPWPTAIDFYGADNDFYGPKIGNAGMVTANVVDPTLQAYLGKTQVSINYNLDIWVVISSVIANTTIHVSSGGNGPLMVSHSPNGNTGRVLFTTFHNEQQLTADMTNILYFLVFEL